MTEQTPAPPPPTPPPGTPPGTEPTASTPPAPTGPTISIGEEFGTAKKNLPPAKIVLMAIGAVVIVVLIASFLRRAKPQASGTLDNVVAVEIPGQTNTMAALTFTLHNTSDKALYVRSIEAKVTTASGETKADAMAAMDFERYFQAFPPLKEGAQPPLSPETRMEVGDTLKRTILVAFPIAVSDFNQRKSVSVVVWPYNYTVPVEMTK
jgi:hypothetical protein